MSALQVKTATRKALRVQHDKRQIQIHRNAGVSAVVFCDAALCDTCAGQSGNAGASMPLRGGSMTYPNRQNARGAVATLRHAFGSKQPAAPREQRTDAKLLAHVQVGNIREIKLFLRDRDGQPYISLESWTRGSNGKDGGVTSVPTKARFGIRFDELGALTDELLKIEREAATYLADALTIDEVQQ
jgi:hypothetical protein